MKKFAKLINVFLMSSFVMFFTFCKKDEVKTIHVDSKWNISLLHDTITVKDMLNDADTAWNNWLSYDENGNLYSVFYDSLERIISGKDFLGDLNDQHFSSHNEIDVMIPAVPNFHVPLFSFNLLSAPLMFNDISITEAEIMEGSIDINLTTPNIDIIDTLILTTHQIIMEDGNYLSMFLDFSSPTTMNQTVDLSSCEIRLNENNEIKFDGQISLTSDGNSYDNIIMDIDISLVNLKFHSIEGNPNIFTPFHRNEPAKFGTTSVSGNLYYTPSVSIEYINTFGFDNTIVIDTLGFYDIDNKFVTLLKNDSVYAHIGHCEDYNETSLNGIVETVGIMNDYKLIEYDGYVTLTGNENGASSYINDDDYISFIMRSEIPLKFKTSNLIYRDTVGIDITSVDNIDYIDELNFRFIFDNTLQCKIIPQIYLSQNGDVFDSLFNPKKDFIAGCYDGSHKTSIVDVPIDADKIDDVIKSDQLILKFQLNTENHTLVFNTNQYFDVRIGLELESSSIHVFGHYYL